MDELVVDPVEGEGDGSEGIMNPPGCCMFEFIFRMAWKFDR